MAFEVQQGGEPQQVSGSTPLSQGDTPAATQPQEQSAQTQAPSTPATIQTGASVNQATSQGNAQNRSSGGASSGMFTNVQRYVERNRPQAQKMAQAVTQDFGKQADAIRQQADQQRQQQQQQIQANQAQMQQQMQEAQNIVGGVMGTAPQAAAQPNFDDQLTRFQALSQGPVGVQQVSDLNLGQQVNKAQALSNLAQGTNRENFRRNLMSQAFDDRQYTRGQSALDNLILGGDQSAREQIIEGTQGRAEALNQRLKQLGLDSSTDVGAQIQAMRDFGGQVRGIATGAEEQATSDLETGLKDFLAQRENLLVDEFGNVTSALDARRNEILNRISPEGEGKNDLLKKYGQLLQQGQVSLGSRGDNVIGQLASEGFNFDPQVRQYTDVFGTGGGSGTSYYTPEYLQRIAEAPFLNANRALYDSLGYGTEANLGLMTGEEAAGNIWNTSRSSNRSKSDQFFKADTLADTFQRAIDQQRNLDFNKQISDALAGVSGVGRDDLIAGTDVDKFDVADETQLQRFNRLQQLLGEEGDIVADEMRNKNFATADALSNVLNRYRMK